MYCKLHSSFYDFWTVFRRVQCNARFHFLARSFAFSSCLSRFIHLPLSFAVGCCLFIALFPVMFSFICETQNLFIYKIHTAVKTLSHREFNFRFEKFKISSCHYGVNDNVLVRVNIIFFFFFLNAENARENDDFSEYKVFPHWNGNQKCDKTNNFCQKF